MALRRKLRSNRPLSSPRGDGSCFSNFLCPPPTTRTALLEGLQKGKKVTAMRYKYVGVENNIYTVEEPLFCDLRPHAEGTSPSMGSSPKTPLILPATSASEFEILRDAHTAEKCRAPSTLHFTDLLIVGDLAKRFQIKRLMKWFLIQFEKAVCPPYAKMPNDAPEPSMEHQTEVFMMSTYLAVSYSHQRALESLSKRWITRLHNRSLAALPTIMFVYGPGANAPQLIHLLAHACYVYLADLSAEARRRGMKPAELLHHNFKGRRDAQRFALPRRLYDQIREGNSSLEKTWEKMFLDPPQGQPGASCSTHAQCVDTWMQRWDVTALRCTFLPKMDVLQKLVVLVSVLEGDVILKHGMNTECRENAINFLRQTRDRLSRHLYHHFDLD